YEGTPAADWRLGRDLVLDLRRVSYMNSSGLGELVRIHDEMEKKNLTLVLIRLDPEVQRLGELLGLDNLLHIYPHLAAALEAIDRGLKSAPAAKVARKGRTVLLPLRSAPRPKLPEARILLGLNGDPHFARFLAYCLAGKGGKVVMIDGRDQALRAMREGKIDIAILDSLLPDARAICADLKTTRQNGIGSVIFIYASREESSGTAFRVCEDEFVLEPFEVREIIALAQSEYERCRAESILFVQEANLEMMTREEAMSAANATLERLIGDSGLPRDSADGLLYAVREAIDNARRHGNLSQPQKLVQIQYVLDKEKVTITVGDEGKGFDIEAVLKRARAVTPIEQARSRHATGGYGGLGISLMLRCCDKVEYLPPGNIVKLTKYL
ncbi:MAG: ATP-binding protein, partial [Planctomycetota bacterium]|nr:ATP-binding protein [Planctomycetota bacterium]